MKVADRSTPKRVASILLWAVSIPIFLWSGPNMIFLLLAILLGQGPDIPTLLFSFLPFMASASAILIATLLWKGKWNRIATLAIVVIVIALIGVFIPFPVRYAKNDGDTNTTFYYVNENLWQGYFSSR